MGDWFHADAPTRVTFTEVELQAHKEKLARHAKWRQKVAERTGNLPSPTQERLRKYHSREGTCDWLEKSCPNRIHAKQLCMKHYQRARRARSAS